jgi:hypothetical protein
MVPIFVLLGIPVPSLAFPVSSIALAALAFLVAGVVGLHLLEFAHGQALGLVHAFQQDQHRGLVRRELDVKVSGKSKNGLHRIR